MSLPISLGNIYPPVLIPVTTPSFALTVFLYRRPRESAYEYVCALRLARPANLPPAPKRTASDGETSLDKVLEKTEVPFLVTPSVTW